MQTSILFSYAGYYAKNLPIPIHSHRGVELVYVSKGECETVFAGGISLPAKAGTVYVSPPEIAHVQKNLTEDCETYYSVMEISGKITLADDSGLEIDYLDKAPGIYSARFLGEDTPYPEKFKVILEKLKDVEEKDRTARFVSCIVAAFPDGRRLVSLDTVEGIIGWEPTGENGFGYDPIFYVPELKKYMAELSSEEKNAISHRGKALRKMKELLKKEL